MGTRQELLASINKSRAEALRLFKKMQSIRPRYSVRADEEECLTGRLRHLKDHELVKLEAEVRDVINHLRYEIKCDLNQQDKNHAA